MPAFSPQGWDRWKLRQQQRSSRRRLAGCPRRHAASGQHLVDCADVALRFRFRRGFPMNNCDRLRRCRWRPSFAPHPAITTPASVRSLGRSVRSTDLTACRSISGVDRSGGSSPLYQAFRQRTSDITNCSSASQRHNISDRTPVSEISTQHGSANGLLRNSLASPTLPRDNPIPRAAYPILCNAGDVPTPS